MIDQIVAFVGKLEIDQVAPWSDDLIIVPLSPAPNKLIADIGDGTYFAF
ncbi:hypothetical protein B4123_3712 [Bacillus paralicheniformis]|uniref:Uncharacterized protein n=1 Tax=Bacillus paralicheniformis TaxID=1648923 RepID=A0ABY3FQB4_9BACI|nr:hypothetical protein B4125_1169 [Bacillus paralicheniformis]OLG08444.1 hypothetical protein B4123_3712 [Bacillus paralicheniformis]TWJ55453.1 hypothetical protein CHCC5023_2651 [Bacillus paralicheniformis]TWJ73264.1 hypothetical protein CHCC5019_0509 [Bacillus paralicheniformis]TWJ78993.1 hypothetical protein CHCC20497_3001 [Bacillus paralicheniformis]